MSAPTTNRSPQGGTPQSQAAPRRGFLSNVASTWDYVRQRPGFDYLMLRIIIFLLVGIGLAMVYSASMTWSLAENTSLWAQALRQSIMVFAGFIGFVMMLRLRPSFIRKAVPWLLGISILLLVLVLIPGIGTGREEVGSQSWIVLGPLSLQPSEIARVTVGIYGAAVLADRKQARLSFKDPFAIYGYIASAMFLLIILEGDVGMAASFAVVVVLTMFFAGFDWRALALIFFLGALGLVGLLLGGGFRSHRFHTYFDALRGNIEDTQGTGFQAYQGFLSLADGGVSGVGLGQSRAKWFYLPEAKNDFIYAIVGEELGLWGAALVVILFGGLGWIGIRTASRAQTQFQALLAATLTAGVVSQAFFNIGYVVGLLPVTGIQLPMISAGGTSAIITITSMGLLASVARHEPENISAMQNYGRPLFDRLFFIPEPRPAQSAGSRARGRRGEARGDRPSDVDRHAPQGRRGPGSGDGDTRGQRTARGARGGRSARGSREEYGRPVTSRRSRAQFRDDRGQRW